MRNTRTVQRPIRKLLKGAGSAILLATLFILVFAGTLSGAFGIENSLQESGIIESNVADAASTYTATLTSNTVTFKNNSTNVSTYLNEITEVGTFEYKSSEYSKVGNSNWNFKHAPSYGYTNNGNNWGDEEYYVEVMVAFKLNEPTSKFYKIRSAANVALWVEGGGYANVSAKAATAVSNTETAPSYDYPARQNDNTSNSIVKSESASHGAHIGVYRRKNAVFADTDNVSTDANAQITSANEITVRGGNTFYVFVKMYCWDDANNADISRALFLDSVTFIATETSPFDSGNGTKTNPFLLQNRNDFDLLSYYLRTDIDFQGYYFKVQPDTSNKQDGYIDMLGTAYTPGGLYDSAAQGTFKGNLDGNNVEIKNLVISVGSGTARAALIGTAGDGAVIRNVYIGSGSSVSSQRSDAAGIVGFATGTVTISCCKNYASVYSPKQNGGIVANVASGANVTITDCYNYGTITGIKDIGGIVGIAQSACVIEDCINADNATVNSNENGGGIVGKATAGTQIKNCQNNGSLTQSIMNVGYDIIQFDATISKDTENVYQINDGNVGTKYCTSKKGAMSFVVELRDDFKVSKFAITNGEDTSIHSERMPKEVYIWGSNNWSGRDNYTSGGGNSPEGANLTGWKSLYSSNNIGLGSADKARKEYWLNEVSEYEYIWIRVVGNDGQIQFSEFELLSSEPTNVGGIVGYADGTSSNNVVIDSAVNSGAVTGNNNVGGIVGGGIFASLTTSATNSGDIKGVSAVGGIAGCAGDINTSDRGFSIANAINTGTITSTGGEYVGGIVGYSRDTSYNGTIKNEGLVSAANSKRVGGVVGFLYGRTLTGAVNSGKVQGSAYVGGVVGVADWGTINGATNSGDVSASGNNVGGILGWFYKDNNSSNASYISGALTNTGCVSGDESVGGIVGRIESGKTDTFVWNATSNITSNGLNAGDGVRGHKYVGGAIGYLSANVTIKGSISVLGRDVDSNGYDAVAIGGIAGYNAGTIQKNTESDVIVCAVRVIARSNSTTVGSVDYNGTAYTGSIIGGIVGFNVGTIEGATRTNKDNGDAMDVISFPNRDYLGGIAGVNLGTLTNCENTSSYVGLLNTTKYGGQYVGGIVGYNAGTVGNCKFTSIVNGTNYVGGFVGYNIGTLTIPKGTTNTSTVSGENYVGGIVGYTKQSRLILENLTNSGIISGANYVGGIVGGVGAETSVINCVNNSTTIKGTSYVGGIVGGALEKTTVTSGVNNGEISGTSYIGGIVGGIDENTAADLTITNSHNNEAITSTSNNVGGILGGMGNQANSLIISKSYNVGTVSCTGSGGNVGGIVGRIYTTRTYEPEKTEKSVHIANCYNTGNVSEKNDKGLAGDSVGGIVGYLYAADTNRALVEYCYNYAHIEGKELVGGIIGSGASGSSLTINYCYVVIVKDAANTENSKDILSNSTCGAIIGGSYDGIVVSNFDVVNSWGFLALNADNQQFNNLGKVLFTDLTVTPQIKGNNGWSNVEWTDILTKYINGFKVTGTTAKGTYASSIWENSAKESAGYDYKNEAKPSSIETNSTANGTGVAAQTDCAIEFTFYYDASYDIEFNKIVGVRVEVKNIVSTENQQKEYNSQKQVITNPTTPQITNKSEYGIGVVYFDDAAHTQNLTTDGKTKAGTYYYIADITLGGKVVGRYLDTFEITPYDFANKTFNEDYWFGANDNVIVTNQDKTRIVYRDGTAYLFLLNSDASDRPQALIYQGAAGYDKENFVLYIKYTIIDKDGHVSTVVLPCDEFDVTNFVSGLDSGEHVREATEIEIQGSGGNIEGAITRYYTLLDSDFGGNVTDKNNEWGSADNPYLISTQAQLIRLSQIFNGGTPWNSVKGLSLAYEGNAFATDLNYSGAYFRVEADLDLDNTFKPIGSLSQQFKAALFEGKKSNGKAATISYAFVDAQRDYVGLFGYADGTHFKNLTVQCVDGLITGKNYVGGIVGYLAGSVNKIADDVTVLNGIIENCMFIVESDGSGVKGEDYVGGIVGYANNAAITESDSGLMGAKVYGTNYVGGIAGKWVITSVNQFNKKDTDTNKNSLSYKTTQSCYIGSEGDKLSAKYVGGIAGMLDASGCEDKLNILAIINNGQTTDTNGPTPTVTVRGSSYLGTLYGLFVGNNATNTVLEVNDASNIYATLKLSEDGNVVGGLVGMLKNAALKFSLTGDNGFVIHATNIVFDFASYNPSFFGGIVGVLAEGATICGTGSGNGNAGKTLITNERYFTFNQKTTVLDFKFGTSSIFVGGIVGYVSAAAGKSTETATSTIFGEDLYFINHKIISGGDYIGGIFGGYGNLWDFVKNKSSIKNDAYLSSAISAGDSTHIGTFKPAQARNMLVSNSSDESNFVISGDDYVGGIIGAIGAFVRIEFVNEQIQRSDTSVNIYNENLINGTNYVGGLTGYLGNGSHTITRFVNNGKVSGKNYVGGLVGYMIGGEITDSVSASGRELSLDEDMYDGSENVGGLVGYMQSGSIVNSIATGFLFSKAVKEGDKTNYSNNTSVTKGGVVGGGPNPSINGGWTIYIASAPDYSTVSYNKNGKYVIIDDDVKLSAGAYADVLAMAGIIETATNDTTQQDDDKNYKDFTFIRGRLLLKVSYPSDNTNQLAFYDVSGEDAVTKNKFSVIGNENDSVCLGFKMEEGESYSICKFAVKFSDIRKYNGTDEETKKTNAAEGYKAPSGESKSYSASVTNATYDNDGNISEIIANIYFKDVVIGTANAKVGHYKSSDFSPGSKNNPYTIKNTNEWNDFVNKVKTNPSSFIGMSTNPTYVKLLNDIEISYNETQHEGTGNSGYDFSDSGRYNVAGNMETKVGFHGVFDGNGHSILLQSNLNLGTGASVFPYASDAEFRNLTISAKENNGSIVNGSGDGVAAFVGIATGSLTFKNCQNDVAVQSSGKNVGGLLGQSHSAQVNSKNAIYNFIGCVNQGAITCTSNGNTDASNQEGNQSGIGGIVGNVLTKDNGNDQAEVVAELTLDSCRNTGKIEGRYDVAGIVGRTGAITIIKNCGNTGSVTALGKNNGQRVANMDTYAGGIGAVVTNNASINVFATYNSGDVLGWGNKAGGILAADCAYDTSTTNSKIYYCYNTGNITVGGTTAYGFNIGGATNQSFGVQAGGILGNMVNADIQYCYNTGTILANGVAGVAANWVVRIGGIAGYADGTASQTKSIAYCYNVGDIVIGCYGTGSSENEKTDIATGAAPIVGSLKDYDTGIITLLSSDKKPLNYTLKDCVVYRGNSQSYKLRASARARENGGTIGTIWNLNRISWDTTADETYIDKLGGIAGTRVDDLSKMTALLNSENTVSASGVGILKQSISVFSEEYGTELTPGGGYVYVYGCLPQLAVFAVDTQNGLAMTSMGYGKNDYGEYQEQKAGGKYNPYIIKDGIDLMGVSALVSAGFSFDGKYIEFANGSNNLLDNTVKSIYMPTNSSATTKVSVSETDGPIAKAEAYRYLDSDNKYKLGKSYHLFKLGALCTNNKAISPQQNDAYTAWVKANYSYNNGTLSAGATLSVQNFIPIGNYSKNNAFKGTISGATGNSIVQSLKIVGKEQAGLFEYVKSAVIKNITVTGTIKAYPADNNLSVAGAVVARAFDSTEVIGCKAGDTAIAYVYAYGTASDELITYVGGIVGLVEFSQDGTEGATSVIKKCETVNAEIYTRKSNAGGIIGYAQGSAGNNQTLELNDNKVTKAEVTASTSSTADVKDIGTKIGGIIGSANENITVVAIKCVVGTESDTATVKIIGENQLGGIIGATANSVNEIVDCQVLASTSISRAKRDMYVGNAGESGTAIGGIVGLTADGSGTDPITTTFSGKIVFNGEIVIDVATSAVEGNTDTYDGEIRNVGGIVGHMGAGARIATGAEIFVQGSISINMSISKAHAIGGVAGRTNSVAFSGTFTVSPKITANKAYQVGGFIGKNNGIVDILADNTTINIGGVIKGKEDVGGFIGYNEQGATLLIGADEYRAVRYSNPLNINILDTANISAGYKETDGNNNVIDVGGGDNVGGIVGNNAQGGSISIVKGTIVNNGTIGDSDVRDNVGGIIGINSGNLSTGGSNIANVTLSITNNGSVLGQDYVGGVIGMLEIGTIAGEFTNTGNVVGNDYVGGSIGYVGREASIISTDKAKTLFKNEASAKTASDALVAADTSTVSNTEYNVEGKNFVGGSIGFLLGESKGKKEYKVEFRSKGTVNGNMYIGGSIGVLAGVTDFTDFISEGNMSKVKGTTAIGGSVGFIGVPNTLVNKNEGDSQRITADDVYISVTNTHFEANGTLEVIGKMTDAPDIESEAAYRVGGIGGAIGAIGDKDDNLFDNSNGEKWSDNTYYAGGNLIDAENLYHVGGIVGLIKADNITISNMLAYDTIVKGADNVGGIVGATIGNKTVIQSAYSISVTEGKGTFTATNTNGQAGGIIGRAKIDPSNDDNSTKADTSYWVKGYKNVELAGSNVEKLQSTLGRYTLANENIDGTVYVFTKELIGGCTKHADSDNDGVCDNCGGCVTHVDNNGDGICDNCGKQVDGDTFEEIAIYPTPYDFYLANITTTHPAKNGKKYTVNPDLATEDGDVTLLTSESEFTWEDYFAGSNIKYIEDVSAWVEEKPNWAQYSTGTKYTGWYFVYASDQKGASDQIGKINAIHSTSSEETYTDKWYWKRIANAYTMDERNNKYDTDSAEYMLKSDIVYVVKDGKASYVPQSGTLYATATAADIDKANASGYYMYVASSSKDVKPTSLLNNSVFYFTAQGGTSENVAVYYRSIAMGSALTYNGYTRFAPISLQGDITYNKDINDSFTLGDNATEEAQAQYRNKYFYNSENVGGATPRVPGSYTSNVYVYYFDDECTPHNVGGIKAGVWKIKQRDLTFKATDPGRKVYGSEDIKTTITIANIVKGDQDKIEFALSIAGVTKDTITVDLKQQAVIDTFSNITFTTVHVVPNPDSKFKLSGNDLRYNVVEGNADGKIQSEQTYILTVELTFKDAKDYTISAALKSTEPASYYTLKNAKMTLVVDPATLTLSVDQKPEYRFDSLEHNVTWTVSGFKFTDNITTIAALKPTLYINIDSENSKTVDLSEWFASETETQNEIDTIINGKKLKIKINPNNNTIFLDGAFYKGEYYIQFGNLSASGCNYKFASDTSAKGTPLTIANNELKVEWSTYPTQHIYNQTAGEITATISATYGVDSISAFVQAYFDWSLTSTKSQFKASTPAFTVITEGSKVEIKFATGIDAATYTAKLTKSGAVRDVDCICKDPGSKTHKIDQKTLTLTPTYTEGDKSAYVYTSYHQGLAYITITGILSSTRTDKVYVIIGNALTATKSLTATENKIGNWNSNSTSGTIDAKSYTASVKLGSSDQSGNYQIADTDKEYFWKINKKLLSITGLSSQNVVYDGLAHAPSPSISDVTNGKFGRDTISINYIITKGNKSFVNAGDYTVSVDTDNRIKATRDNKDVTENYDVEGDKSTTFTIAKRQLVINWTDNTLVFNNNPQGQTIASVVATGTGGKQLTGKDLKFTGYQNDIITFKLDGLQTDAGKGTMRVTMSVAYDNADSETSNTAQNYEISSGATQGYEIRQMSISISYKGGTVEKVYDNTTKAPQSNWKNIDFTINSLNATSTWRPDWEDVYTVESVYGNKNVGTNIDVKFTYTFKGNGNFVSETDDGTNETKSVGKITQKEITVTLDKLRSGKATRTYINGNNFYGGESGATTKAKSVGANENTSWIYRAGEGFRVKGWYSSDDAEIIAKYVETGNDRAMFDSYVNGVYNDNGPYGQDKTKFFKKLVFTLQGTNASNYTFVVKIGDNQFDGSMIDNVYTVEVFDKDNTPDGKTSSGIKIEITIKSVRVTYKNTTQSYVNSDGSYRNVWDDVTAENPDGATIDVTNGWKSGTYKSYTVIRGGANSQKLGATIRKGTGMEFNYRLSNQPILTIGYFIDSTGTFEINSLATLLIASFYRTASQNPTEQFMKIIKSGFEVKIVVSEADYDANKNLPDGYETWDEYFEYLETELHVSVFYDEEHQDWRYYAADTTPTEGSIPTSFLQTKDIDGKFTADDIAMLDAFFTAVQISDDGQEQTPVRYNWGYGTKNGENAGYIDNIVKVGVGNIAVAIGSIFKSYADNDGNINGFAGTYDGGGYVIEYFNIMGVKDETNVGMFDIIGGTATVKNLHLRNFVITAKSGNVGGIAGSVLAGETAIENVSWHGTISMSGDGNVGGLTGLSARAINKATALGSISAKGGNIGGLIGSMGQNGSISNAVSFVYVDATGTVSATVATSGANVSKVYYLANSAWKRSDSALTVSNVSYGTAKTYTELIQGSYSGYSVSGNEYYSYAGEKLGGEFDMLDDFDYSEQSAESIQKMNARQSLRLKDIVDVYMLMYSIEVKTVNVNSQEIKVYGISVSSWLVGSAHGTDDDKITVANKQQLALLRELRFASFILTADIAAPATSNTDYVYGGAFFGSVSVAANGDFTIDFGGKKAFEATISAIPSKSE